MFAQMLETVSVQSGTHVVLSHEDFYDLLLASPDAVLYVNHDREEQSSVTLDLLGCDASVCTGIMPELKGLNRRLFILHAPPVFTYQHHDYPLARRHVSPFFWYDKTETETAIIWVRNHRLDDMVEIAETMSIITKLYPTFESYGAVYIHCDALKDEFFRRLLASYN